MLNSVNNYNEEGSVLNQADYLRYDLQAEMYIGGRYVFVMSPLDIKSGALETLTRRSIQKELNKANGVDEDANTSTK